VAADRSPRGGSREINVSVDLKWVGAAGVLAVAVAAAPLGVSATPAPSSVHRPVVVAELFTSEGCSSCPPADDVLSQLAEQSAPAVEVLALGEHVDYWDRLGWRDPYSSPAYSNRQSEYDAHVFHRHEVYTPQLVIDGSIECVGSDVQAVRQAITKAAAAPKAIVEITVDREHDETLRVRARVEMPPELSLREPAELLLAVTEDHLRSEVRRGENRGRTLTHSAVVRSLASIGTLSQRDRAWSTSASVALAPDWRPANVRIVALLQERNSRRIVGAGVARLGVDAANLHIE
jgi:hypothetical protein